MAVAHGTYDITIKRRSDHNVYVTLKDSGGSAVNLTGYTLASQIGIQDVVQKRLMQLFPLQVLQVERSTGR